MDTGKEGGYFKEDSEVKKEAGEVFKVCVAGAKMFCVMAWDFFKKVYSEIRDKVKELGEKIRESRLKAKEEEENRSRMYEEQVQKITQCFDVTRQAAEGSPASQHVATRSMDKWRGDPEDKCFLVSYGWLYFIWWIVNIITSILCLRWFVSAMDNYYSRGSAWIALVVLGLVLLFNRLVYEGAVALFEMVRHLRQIRDELRQLNMRGDKFHKDEHAGEAMH